MKKNIVVIGTELGEVKTCDGEEIKEIKKSLSRKKAEELLLQEQKQVLELAEKQIALGKKKDLFLFIAKSIFDNYVDKGETETNDEFEELFKDFIFKGKDLDLEKCPKVYKAIVERLGKDL